MKFGIPLGMIVKMAIKIALRNIGFSINGVFWQQREEDALSLFDVSPSAEKLPRGRF